MKRRLNPENMSIANWKEMTFCNKSFRSVETPGNLKYNVDAWCISVAISHNIVELNSARFELHFYTWTKCLRLWFSCGEVETFLGTFLIGLLMDWHEPGTINSCRTCLNESSFLPRRAELCQGLSWLGEKIKVVLLVFHRRNKRRAGRQTRQPSSERWIGLWLMLAKRFIDIIIT